MDQVAALEANGVPVATINSTTPYLERRSILDDLLSGHPRIRLLYVTPEFCETESFRRNLMRIHAQGELSRVAVDEAHCISEWGHDFRPAYKELSWFKRVFKSPPVPITALTATATPRVRVDIINLLGLDVGALKSFNTPSARPNIHYEVKYMTDYAYDPMRAADFQIRDILSWLKSIQSRREARLRTNGTGEANQKTSNSPPMSGIIYVPMRSVADSLARALASSGNNIRAVAYHAGLSADERSRIQTMWTSRTLSLTSENGPTPDFSIIVATNAFGMGIDNPHVRFVVHWTPPRSFEGFVQESGRAGRDGRAAMSMVYYNLEERDRVQDRIKKTDSSTNRNGSDGRRYPVQSRVAKERSQRARLESFKKVVDYCETTDRCRHEIIKEYSGDLELEMMGSTQENSGDWPSSSSGAPTSPCDFACDFCKEGREAITRRREKMYQAQTDMEMEQMILDEYGSMAGGGAIELLQMMYHQGPYARTGFGSMCEQCP